MKTPISFSLLLLLYFIFPMIVYNLPFPRTQRQHHGLSEKISFCRKVNTVRPLNYRGQSLVSNSEDPQDIILCPGDAFGDLSETYIKLENCYLAMYHRNQLIWSSSKNEYWRTLSERNCQCVFSLERDGNLMLYKEKFVAPYRGSDEKIAQYEWDSQTNFNPVKTELRLQGQQVQVIQTFEDGSQRLFFADQDHQEFVEELGTPIKKADKVIIKDHQDQDKIILKRNEYIGDLNGTYLILQANCQLQLLNRNKTLWSFIPPFRHEMNCTLQIAEDNTIEILGFLTGNPVGSFDQEVSSDFMQGPYRESIMRSEPNLEVLKSQMTFEDSHPMIIQTLKNQSELIFLASPGQNNGLKLKRNPKQIALKTLMLENYIPEYIDDSDDEYIFDMKRMDYIGNLTGLHLILEQDCNLRLLNENKRLWELATEYRDLNHPLMECSVKINPGGVAYLKREFARGYPQRQDLFIQYYLLGDNPGFITGVELTLEDNQMQIKLGRRGMSPDIWIASPKTNGITFHFMAKNSIAIPSSYDGEILPQMGYIGDLDGVYTILDRNCNWILYNKTEVIWKAGSFDTAFYGSCYLYETSERELGISSGDWPGFSLSSFTSLFKEVVEAEMVVNNGGLWLVYTFRDGTVQKYRAVPGTNQFGPVLETDDFSFDEEL